MPESAYTFVMPICPDCLVPLVVPTDPEMFVLTIGPGVVLWCKGCEEYVRVD